MFEIIIYAAIILFLLINASVSQVRACHTKCGSKTFCKNEEEDKKVLRLVLCVLFHAVSATKPILVKVCLCWITCWRLQILV